MAELFGFLKKKKEDSAADSSEPEEASKPKPRKVKSRKDYLESGQGKLIVFEGNDGSGKRTQVSMLAEKIRETKEVEVLDFPDYGSFYGKLIRRYLDGEFGRTVSPHLIALAYANDRLLKRDTMKQWLAQGKVVICNRYVASNKAYSAVKFNTIPEMQEFVKWVDEMEYRVNDLPRPDLTIYLYVPSDIAVALVQQRAQEKNIKADIHETLGNMRKVEQVYLAMARNRNWVKIECMKDDQILTRDEIHSKVYDVVKNFV
jgi:dTMP kinase